MVSTPVITIFVRHTEGCKYAGEEFSRRCNCKKHLRWTQEGTQHRRATGARSWAEAEEVKRRVEDQLSGRAVLPEPETKGKEIQTAVGLFIADKRVQGVSKGVLGKYTRELARLRAYMNGEGVYVVQGITRELLTGYAETWEGLYPSSNTRAKVRERHKGFLRYCYEAKWLERVPQLPKIKVQETPTLPLTPGQYAKLLDSVNGVVSEPETRARVHALFQLMRYSGLAIGDALTLPREALIDDTRQGLYRVRTARQKTGTDVSVPVPDDVAAELLAVHAKNGNPAFIFWSGEGEADSIAKNYSKYYVALCFKAAGLHGESFMVSHRLRDTFAVDLLESGVPIEEVSKALGHESIKTTERHYAKWVKARQDRLDDLVVGTWKTGKRRAA